MGGYGRSTFCLMMIDDYDLEVTLVEVVLNFLSSVVGKNLLGGAFLVKMVIQIRCNRFA